MQKPNLLMKELDHEKKKKKNSCFNCENIIPKPFIIGEKYTFHRYARGIGPIWFQKVVYSLFIYFTLYSNPEFEYRKKKKKKKKTLIS